MEPCKPLTRQEIIVFALAAQGKTNQEIADLLYLSKRTIDYHLENIYKKWGVRNRVEALNFARAQGLLP